VQDEIFIAVLTVVSIYLFIIFFCVEIKCQLDATEVFIADLTACSTCFGHHYAHSSGAQEYYTVVAACYVSGLQDAAASCKPDT